MTRKRRTFSADYKQQVARMILDDGLKVADVCRDQDIGETAVRRWMDKLKAERAGGTGEGQPLTAEQQRIRHLEQESRQLKEDKDLLKKASAFFARVRWSKLRGPNLDAPYFVCAHTLPSLSAARGSIIKISSTATLHGNWACTALPKRASRHSPGFSLRKAGRTVCVSMA